MYIVVFNTKLQFVEIVSKRGRIASTSMHQFHLVVSIGFLDIVLVKIINFYFYTLSKLVTNVNMYVRV